VRDDRRALKRRFAARASRKVRLYPTPITGSMDNPAHTALPFC
jgi:hypothetical protein